MALNYERIGWENAPSTNTPIDAGSLNHMDNGILAVSNQYDVDVPYLQEQIAAIPAMLDSYLADQIGIDVTNWLSEHVTPGGSTIVVDDTLTISGAAADSKTVGDALGTKANTSDVNAALATKADTDDVDQLKNALITDSASGSIASFVDGGDGFPVRDLKVQMEPIQDLHGYDHPWSAGGGKNLLPLTVADLKSANSYGSWNGDVYTHNGVTFTIQTDAGGNVVGILVNGTASGGTSFVIIEKTNTLPSWITQEQSYIFNGNGDNDVNVSLQVIPKTGSTYGNAYLSKNNDVSFAISGTYNGIYIRLRIENGVAVNNVTMKPIFRLSTESDSSFEPYTNICPISGRDSVTVTRTGVNIWDEEWEVGTIDNATGQNATDSTRIRSKGYIPVLPSTKYRCVCSANNGRGAYYDINKQFISCNAEMFVYKEFTTPDNCYYVRFSPVSTYGATYNHDISINYPATDTDYHAGHVQTVTIQLGQTVYGGTLDVTTGVLTVDSAIVDLGTLDWTYDSMNQRWSGETGNALYTNYRFAGFITEKYASDTTGAAGDNNKIMMTFGAFYLYSTDSATKPSGMCVYPLATPQTYQLTPQQVTTLLGLNNIWSDADSVSVDYVADTKLYIAKVIADALS